MTRQASDDTDGDRRLESALAMLLEWGTAIACAVVGIGLAVQAFAGAEAAGLRIVTGGLIGFLALPVLRLLAVLGVLLRRRDSAFAGIAGLVLAIIAVAFAIGALVPK